MGVRITVVKTGRPLADIKLSTRELMKEVGLLARERVVRRTLAGRDEHNASFQPYSATYARAKLQDVGSSRVNLQLSGAMLNAIVITALTDTSVTLGFSS